MNSSTKNDLVALVAHEKRIQSRLGLQGSATLFT